MTLQIRNVVRITFLSIALVAVTACGGGGSTPPPPPPAMYSIGGKVSGLDAGQSVVLQLNGGNDLTVSSNAAFTFASKIASDVAYAVTVAGDPAGKTCTVNGGVGTASANVTGVVVTCVPALLDRWCGLRPRRSGTRTRARESDKFLSGATLCYAGNT